MKSLRNLAVGAVACALCSAAPTRGEDPKAAPAQNDPRAEVVKKYFAAPAAAQPKPDTTDPKWVELMQQTMKELTDENVRLRKENLDLRKDRDALQRSMQELETMRRRRNEQRGTFNVTPDLIVPPGQGNNQVPPNWKPFDFNGATYYMIPLEQSDPQNGAQRKKLILTPPEAKK